MFTARSKRLTRDEPRHGGRLGAKTDGFGTKKTSYLVAGPARLQLGPTAADEDGGG